MDIKHCPKCGKELPVESHFCPYCMTKLIAENGTEIPIVDKTKQRKKYAVILVMLVVIIVEVIAVVKVYNKDNKEIPNQKTNDATETSQDDDYTQYLGVWFDEQHKDESDVTETGGKKIEICKVTDNEIIFNIESISSSSYIENRACLNYVRVSLNKGKGIFGFTDDGFGNSGTGEIQLSDGKIYARVELDNSYEGGRWDLSMDTDFVQVEKYEVGQVFDIVDSLTKFDSEKSKFGSLTELDKYGDFLSYFYENAITIDVDKIDDTGELYIVEMWIEYDMLQSDYKYCYRGIDNTSTKEDVENILGKDNVVFLDGYCNYTDEEREATVRLYINEEGYVDNINYIKNY